MNNDTHKTRWLLNVVVVLIMVLGFGTGLVPIAIFGAAPVEATEPEPVVVIAATKTNVNPGEVVTVRGVVQNVQAAWLDGQPIIDDYGEITEQLWNTKTYTLQAQLKNGQFETRSATVYVNGSGGLPPSGNPKLVIRNGYYSPQNPVAGQPVQFTFDVANEGDGPASTYRLNWRPSPQSQLEVKGSGDGTPITAGGSKSVSFWHTFDASNTYDTMETVDMEGQSLSLNTTQDAGGNSNFFRLSVTVGNASPSPGASMDLGLEMSWVTPDQPAATNNTTEYFSSPPVSGEQMTTTAGPVGVGDVVTIQFTASSYMTSAGHPYRVIWRPSPSAPYMLVSSFTTEELGPNEGVKRTNVFEYVFSAPGTYETDAIIKYDDPAIDGQESDKQNNMARMRIVVGDPTTPPSGGNPAPNLTHLRADYTTIRVGQPLRFLAGVHNTGDAPADNLILQWRPHSGAPFETIRQGFTLSHQIDAGEIEFTRTFNAPGTYDTQAVLSFAAAANTLQTESLATASNSNSQTLQIAVTP